MCLHVDQVGQNTGEGKHCEVRRNYGEKGNRDQGLEQVKSWGEGGLAERGAG